MSLEAQPINGEPFKLEILVINVVVLSIILVSTCLVLWELRPSTLTKSQNVYLSAFSLCYFLRVILSSLVYANVSHNDMLHMLEGIDLLSDSITQFVIFRFVIEMKEISLKLRVTISTVDLVKGLRNIRSFRVISYSFFFTITFVNFILWMLLERNEWADKVNGFIPFLSLSFVVVNIVNLVLELIFAWIFIRVFIELIKRKAIANMKIYESEDGAD